MTRFRPEMLTALCGTVLLSSVSGTAAPAEGGEVWSAARLLSARREARQRRRRIIFNNDSDDQWMAKEPTPAAYLATRMRPSIDSQVDTVFLSTTQDIGYYSHRSEIAALYDRDHPGLPLSRQVMLVKNLAEQGTDILDVSVPFLHEHGKEILWSHRMNGMEDMVAEFLLSGWKRDRPQWWLATPDFADKYPTSDHRHWFRVMDYGVPEVREYVLAVIAEVIEKYDIDGVELDYLRDPWLFKETFGDPVRPATPVHCRVMVDFHSQVRALLDAKSRRIRRPLLLAIRVPKWVHISKFLGLDIEATLQSGAIDLLIGSGGYTPFAPPPTEFIALGHRYGVPVHVCISGSGMRAFGDGSRQADLAAWRGAALNHWHAGADGQYVFNTMPNGPEVNLALQVMREIGDPAAMRGKDLVFALNSYTPIRNAGYCNLAIDATELLPAPLHPRGRATTMSLYVGVDLAQLANADKLAGLRLRVRYTGRQDTDIVKVRLNRRELSETEEAWPGSWTVYRPAADAFKPGKNALEFRLTRRAAGRAAGTGPVTVDAMELDVDTK